MLFTLRFAEVFIGHVQSETTLPLCLPWAPCGAGKCYGTSFLQQVLGAHFDFTFDFASSKLTVDKFKKTFHRDIAAPPQKPPFGGFLCLQPLLVLPLTHGCSNSKSTILSERMI